MDIKCNLCGRSVSENDETCSGCGIPRQILESDVQLPAPLGAVNDFAGLLSEAEAGELASMVTSFFNDTTVPIVLATVETTGDLLPSEYAFLLYNHWGIGAPGINRGVLILLCRKERHLESEVGTGLEDILPESEGDEIVAKFVKGMKGGKYYKGLRSGTKEIIKILSARLPILK